MKNIIFVLAASILVGCDVTEPVVAETEAVITDVKAPAKMSAAVPEGWTENFAEAKQLAKEANKKILLAFSGSDWCGWCVRLDKEVYSQKEFFDLAVDKYVLVLIDCPQDPTRLSDFAKTQNHELTKQFNVRGFPCGVILDSEGVEIGRISGYVQGGPKAYFERMQATRLGPLAQ